jgi:NADPH:quinone reductase-like Zn-dependent oxidoreductase
MLASWYDVQGPAADVLHVGELPDPVPGPGEVRVRVTVSGVNPGDTKKRRGWLGSSMPFPRVIPHSDGAGVIDAVGAGVDVHRVGQRVWVYGAQSTAPSAPPPSTPSYPTTRPRPCPTTSVTSWARASASPASPLTAPSSPTARSTANWSWSTEFSAASAPWPPSSPTGPAPP